jgi:predicted 3-demethylubiquinone-9 3-methyltransferase (glyoxalase superfamily)
MKQNGGQVDMNIKLQKITPFFWFDYQAEEAANFYVSIFENSKILDMTYYGEAGPGSAGSVMMVAFQLTGQPFLALNGGPEFTFTPALSMFVNCETQEEVDDLWEKLSAGGKEGPCGWLEDKYGVSWQIVPFDLLEMVNDPDPAKSQMVMHAMFQMKKLDIAELKRAYEQ